MPRPAAFLSKPELRALIKAQDGVLSRTQLFEAGATRHHLRNRVMAGLWQEIGPHAVALHSGPLSAPQQLWAAVLHGGPDAVLGRLTAAQAHGLRGFESPALHVVAPHGTNRDDLHAPQIQVIVHESLRLGDLDVHPLHSPPRTRLPRSIVDSASEATSDRRCRAIIAASVQQRLVPADHLRANARGRPTLPRRALILETIGDVEGGSHSLPELDFVRGMRRLGLPEPTRQRRVQRPDGHYYLDIDIDEFEVSVEINGAQHLDQIVKETDDIRRTRLSIGGRLMVDVGSYTVRHEIDTALLLTAEALRSRGWRPDETVQRRLDRMATARGDRSWSLLSA